MGGTMARRSVLAGLGGLSLGALAACGRAPALSAPEGVTLTHVRTISRVEAWGLLRLTGLQGVRAAHNVDCWRMIYPTTDKTGAPSVASGLFALPRGAPARRIASFQHGTASARDAVPSKPDGTGLAAAILFAGNGYAALAPDYHGMGASPGPHPYLVAQAAARAVIDMIDAARRIDGAPQGPVFLSGFSQGGHATMAALRALEARGETVLGAAPVAGPYGLRDISLGAALAGGARSHALYLAYLAWGYAHYYDEPLESALTPHYAARAATLFATPHKAEDVMAALPDDPRAMFTRAFLDAFDANGDHWLLTRMSENGVRDFTPRAPVRLYYGEDDVDVVPAETLEAQRLYTARGADVRAVSVGAKAHDPSMLTAAPAIQAWLSELEAAAI